MTVVAGPGGQAEVHKRATTAADAHRLAREATTLRRARHPGVVDLVELRPDEHGDGAVLVTRLAGTHTLATWVPPTLDEIAGVLVALAETLADLHHLGIAHGAVDAEHVVIDAAGRPVLCGFERTRDHRRTDDVAALGRLARHLLDLRPDRGLGADPGAPRREPRRRANARRRLLDLADQAAGPDEHARPGARRFAAAVLAAAPDAAIGSTPATVRSWSHDTVATPDDAAGRPDDAARRPDGSGDEPPAPPHDPDHGRTDDRGDAERSADAQRRAVRAAPAEGPSRDPVDPDPTGDPDPRPPRVLRTGVAVVGLACLVFGGLSAWTGERPPLAASPVAGPAPIEPTSTGSAPPDPPTGAGPTAATTTGSGPAPTGPGDGRPDVTDGDCAAAPVTCSIVRPGGVIDRDGQRYALGGPGDEIVLADARCSRGPAVALVRPDEGTVYLFDRWAGPGDDVVARRGPDVAVGSHWQPRPLDAAGCADLVLVAPGAAPVILDLDHPPPGPAGDRAGEPDDDETGTGDPTTTEGPRPPPEPGGPR